MNFAPISLQILLILVQITKFSYLSCYSQDFSKISVKKMQAGQIPFTESKKFPMPAKTKSETFSLAVAWKHIYKDNWIFLCSYLFTWLVHGKIQGLAISVENLFMYTCKMRIKSPHAAQHRLKGSEIPLVNFKNW